MLDLFIDTRMYTGCIGLKHTFLSSIFNGDYAEGGYEPWKHRRAISTSRKMGHIMGEGEETVNDVIVKADRWVSHVIYD